MNDAIWTTKDGDDIRVGDMTDTHIQNTVLLLERKCGEELPGIYYDILQEGTIRKIPMCVERFEKLSTEYLFEKVKDEHLANLEMGEPNEDIWN